MASGDVDASATREHSAADPAAAPKPRGRKRTCEHGAPDEPRPKAASCRKCAAERKALSRWRGKCEAKPKLLAAPPQRGSDPPSITIHGNLPTCRARVSVAGRLHCMPGGEA